MSCVVDLKGKKRYNNCLIDSFAIQISINTIIDYLSNHKYMDTQNGDSGANTVLIVIVLMILVGFGAWWFTMNNSTPTPKANPINIDVKIPTPTPTPTETNPPSTEDPTSVQ